MLWKRFNGGPGLNNINDVNNVNECTGCSLCEAICPKHAIKISLSEEGFYIPDIDSEKCISCEICRSYCYKFDENVKAFENKNIKCYSAINKNKTELESSTSGGFSIELMKECLKQGYKIAGVAYDNNKNIAITEIADNINDIQSFKGSKYFQSYTADALNVILHSNDKYAFFGTPCQIYSINRYINDKQRRDNFVFIDVFCHGTPSLNLWNKYLNYSADKFNVSGFDLIQFRSKVHGWHNYSFLFNRDSNQYKSSKLSDPFYEMFFDKHALNMACYECKTRSTLAYTDIRLGDFWGNKYDTNITGVSGVVINTEKGKALFDAIKNNFILQEHDFNDLIKFQSFSKQHEYNPSRRMLAINLLASEKKLSVIMKEYRKGYTNKHKIKMFTKKIIKLIPTKLLFKIKEFIHTKD